jgi:hypothetical protein
MTFFKDRVGFTDLGSLSGENGNMGASWLGAVADVVQLTGPDAVRLIAMLGKAASKARMTWNIYFLILFYNIELLKIRFYNLF